MNESKSLFRSSFIVHRSSFIVSDGPLFRVRRLRAFFPQPSASDGVLRARYQPAPNRPAMRDAATAASLPEASLGSSLRGGSLGREGGRSFSSVAGGSAGASPSRGGASFEDGGVPCHTGASWAPAASAAERT